MLKSISMLVTRYPWLFIAGWAVILLIGMTGAINVSDVYEEAHYSEAGSTESEFATQLLKEEFGDIQTQRGNAFFVIFVVDQDTNITDSVYQTLIQNIAGELQNRFQGDYLISHYWSNSNGETASYLSADGMALYMTLIPTSEEVGDNAVDDVSAIRDIVRELVATASLNPEPEYAVTGGSAAMADSMSAAQESMEESDVIAMITVTAVLLFIFGSITGVGIPLAALIAVLVSALGLLYYLGLFEVLSVSEMVPNIISMLGIGICADYNLLLLSRFREEMNNGADSAKAARKSMQTAGKTVIFSGFTVMIGFGSLMFLGGGFAISISVAVLLVVSLAILSVLTLSPALLTLVGHRLEWPQAMSRFVASLKRAGSKEGESFWARWSHTVQRRPWTFLLIGVIILFPLVALATQMKLSLPGVEFLPEGTESRTGYEMMDKHFSVGEISPVQVVLRDSAKTQNSIIANSRIISGIAELATWATNHQDVASIIGPNVFYDVHKPNESRILDHTTFQAAVSSPTTPQNAPIQGLFYQTVDWNPAFGGNNDTAVVTVMLSVSSGSSESWGFIRDLREKVGEIFPDTTHHVGGSSASFLDQNDEMWKDFPLMITICMTLTFLVLMFLFRSILLPIKSIITILASVFLSYGVLVLVFQEGIGANLLGIEATGEGIIFFMPLFLFTAIFGLSMDYNVFILTRVKEEYDKSGDNAHSVALGIEKTGSVVTSAALIMVATFAVFIFSDMVFMQMIGLGLAVAVIVDATLIRTIILPSAMKLLGDWNWWLPDWLDRIMPKIDVED
ncbi:MAG: MMPL family transporter [Candidatus Hodarchaeales archaeon]